MKTRANFINLTPHDLILYTAADEEIVVPRSGRVARVDERRVLLEEAHPFFHDLDVVKYEPGDIVVVDGEGNVGPFPEPQLGTIYIVSRAVLQALRDKGQLRSDVLAPDTNKGAVRDANGRILGVRALVAMN